MDSKDAHNEHRDRLRDRFITEGIDGFEPHTVLELLLFYAIPRRDTNEIAHRLIDRFGSLAGVFNAPVEELMQVNGMGKNSAVLVSYIASVTRRYYSDKPDCTFIRSVEDAGEYLKPRYIGRTDEAMFVLLLDGQGKILACGEVGDGVVNEVRFSVRKIVEMTLRYKAVSVILSHHHPGGLAIPSPEDCEATWNVRRALELIGVGLTDHIIVAGDDYVSMRQSRQYRYIFESVPEDDPDGEDE